MSTDENGNQNCSNMKDCYNCKNSSNCKIHPPPFRHLHRSIPS